MTNLDDLIKKDRFVNRRKMAWRSFWMFSGMGTFLVLLGLYRPDMVTGVWPQAMFVMGLWGSVVAGYFTVTWNTDKTEITQAVQMERYNGPPAPLEPLAASGPAQSGIGHSRPPQPAGEVV